MYLNSEGQEFYSKSNSVVADLKDAQFAVNATSLDPTGLLRARLHNSWVCAHGQLEQVLPQRMLRSGGRHRVAEISFPASNGGTRFICWSS